MRALPMIAVLVAICHSGCAGEQGKVGDEESRALFASSMEELKLKMAAHENLFQISKADWDLDQDAGTIKFTSPEGTLATAPCQIVGTFNKADSTWRWSWDNPSIDEKLTTHARLTKDFGGAHGPDELLRRTFETTEEECWEYTAVTCKLGNFQGAYRGPADDTVVFLTFGELQIQEAKK